MCVYNNHIRPYIHVCIILHTTKQAYRNGLFSETAYLCSKAVRNWKCSPFSYVYVCQLTAAVWRVRSLRSIGNTFANVWCPFFMAMCFKCIFETLWWRACIEFLWRGCCVRVQSDFNKNPSHWEPSNTNTQCVFILESSVHVSFWFLELPIISLVLKTNYTLTRNIGCGVSLVLTRVGSFIYLNLFCWFTQ